MDRYDALWFLWQLTMPFVVFGFYVWWMRRHKEE